jgi:hypothetical protein
MALLNSIRKEVGVFNSNVKPVDDQTALIVSLLQD